MSGAYYNEIDPFAAQWLRNLIAAGHIAPGDVDERSIRDVRADDLRGYTQCHFFAGIGVWSRALRQAGWDDARPVWTGSCPCQPFSAAGKRTGTADERHLWPVWFQLIDAVRPVACFGEQVASKDGLAWLDAVYADLEGAGYACGAVDLCAAGFGAPHIRQRLFFVGVSGNDGRYRQKTHQAEQGCDGQEGRVHIGAGTSAGIVADADGRHPGAEGLQRGREHGFKPQDGGTGVALGDTSGERPQEQPGERRVPRCAAGANKGQDATGTSGLGHPGSPRPQEQRRGREQPEGSAAPSFWSDYDWLPCIDGKARPVESRSQPMADGLAARMGYVRAGQGWTLFPLIQGAESRVGRLRAYGNAIVAPVAAEFIRAFIEVSAPTSTRTTIK